jgi:hypothetical protein
MFGGFSNGDRTRTHKLPAMEAVATPPRLSMSQQVIADARLQVENTPPSMGYSHGRLRTPGTARALQDLRSSIGLNQLPDGGGGSLRSARTAPAGVALTPLSALGQQNSKRRQALLSLAAEVRELAQAAGLPGGQGSILDNSAAEPLGGTAADGLASSRLPPADDDAAALLELVEQVRLVGQAARQQRRRDADTAEVEGALEAAKDKAAQAKLQCLAAEKHAEGLAQELADTKEQVAQLEATVEESGKVLEQAVEIAMQEGFQQASQAQADLEGRMKLMRADRQLYSDQLQALREQSLRERHAAAANAAVATAPSAAATEAAAAEKDSAAEVARLRDEIAQLQDSLRVTKDELWQEQEARQVAEAGLLGAKSGIRKVQEAKESAERRVEELEAVVASQDQNGPSEKSVSAAAMVDGGTVEQVQGELASTQARLKKTEEALQAAMDVHADMEQQRHSEDRAADMAAGELEMQASAAMQRAAMAEQQLSFMEQRIAQQQEQLQEEVGLREAADAAVQELLEQMQGAAMMQNEMQEFAEAQAGQLEQMQAAYSYTEAAAEAERSAREAAEKRLQAFAAMQQARQTEQQRREARYANAEQAHQEMQQQWQEQQRQQQQAYHHTWHAANEEGSQPGGDHSTWPAFHTPQKDSHNEQQPDSEATAGEDTPGNLAAAAFSPEHRRYAAAAGFLPDEYLVPEVSAATSMDAASMEEAAMMAMLAQQMQWEQQQGRESVGEADIEEIVSSEEEQEEDREAERRNKQPEPEPEAEAEPEPEPELEPELEAEELEPQQRPLVTASLVEEMAALHQSVSEPSALLQMLKPRPLSATFSR